MESNKNSIMGGLFWRFSERILAQVVTFIVSIVIARVLNPEAYGMIAILMVFITFADAFVTSGMGNALIQKKDCDDMDFSSVFYFNIAFSILLYLIIFLLAPYVEKWYGNNYTGLTAALRVLAVRIPISAINNVQQAYVSRNMIFRKFFFSTLGGTIGSAVVGISLAYTGFGIWALVGQYLFNAIVDTLVLWFTVHWRPSAKFSLKKLTSLISYGWKLMLGSILEVIYNDLRTVLIGKVYTSADLAYYNRGRQFPGLVIDNVNTSILSVIFPAICAIQGDKVGVKRLVQKAIKVASYIISPMLVGLAIVTDKLIVLLLTDKWLSAAWFVRIFCFIYLFQPITKPFQQIIRATGRSDISLLLQIITKAVGIIGIVISIPLGVKAIAIAHATTTILGALLDMIIGGKIVNYSLSEQFIDLIPSLFLTATMGTVVYIVGLPLNVINSNILIVIIQILIGVVVYLLMSIITRNSAYIYVFETIRKHISRYYPKIPSRRKHI